MGSILGLSPALRLILLKELTAETSFSAIHKIIKQNENFRKVRSCIFASISIYVPEKINQLTHNREIYDAWNNLDVWKRCNFKVLLFRTTTLLFKIFKATKCDLFTGSAANSFFRIWLRRETLMAILSTVFHDQIVKTQRDIRHNNITLKWRVYWYYQDLYIWLRRLMHDTAVPYAGMENPNREKASPGFHPSTELL